MFLAQRLYEPGDEGSTFTTTDSASDQKMPRREIGSFASDRWWDAYGVAAVLSAKSVLTTPWVASCAIMH